MHSVLNFIFDLIKPNVLNGTKPMMYGDKNLNIPDWCIFELRLCFDLLFYGYIVFAISSHYFNPVYVWGYFYYYIFGVVFFNIMAVIFNFLIRNYRKKRKV